MQGLLLNSRVAVAQSDPYGRGPGVTAILTAQEVEKSFGEHHVLRGVSFAVHESDRIALVGLNGSGKSTLMRLLVGSALPAADTADGSDRREAEPDEGLITRRRGLSPRPRRPKSSRCHGLRFSPRS